jgi:hypothetical protein
MPRARPPDLGGPLGGLGEVDLEARAPVRLAAGPDVAAALLDDAVDGRKAEAGAAPDLLGGEEGLEHVGQGGPIHPAPGVAYGEGGVAARCHHGAAVTRGRRCGQVGHLGLDRELAAVRHRVAGVERQVEHHLLQLARVRLHRPERRIELQRHPAVLAHGPAEHRHEPLQHLVEIDHHRLEHLAATEGQELGRHGRGPLRRPPDMVHVGLDGDRQRGVAPDELGGPEDHAHLVIGFVGHPSGEAPDRLHSLRLAELLVGGAALGDVAGHARQPDHPAGRA